jgi:hypothetical protein
MRFWKAIAALPLQNLTRSSRLQDFRRKPDSTLVLFRGDGEIFPRQNVFWEKTAPDGHPSPTRNQISRRFHYFRLTQCSDR